MLYSLCTRQMASRTAYVLILWITWAMPLYLVHGSDLLLLNVTFGTDANGIKTGPAAIGQSPDDFWNIYSRDVPGSNGSTWRASGEIPDLLQADGTPSGVALSVDNAQGAWFNNSQDPMFFGYLYPSGRQGNITVTLKGLPSGEYNFLVYAHGEPDRENGRVTLNIGQETYGPLETASEPGWNDLIWEAGKQYVLFSKMFIPEGEAAVIISMPGTSGLSVLNGIQIEQTDICTPRRALASAVVVNGFVVEIKLSDEGCGYSEIPIVRILDSNGVEAKALAVLNGGRITAINVLDAGNGYTDATEVWIQGPPHDPWLSVRTSKVEVTQNVVIGRQYVLEVSGDLNEWAQVAPPFIAEEELIIQEFDVQESGRFYRIRQIP